MKKIISVFLLLLVSVAVFTACADNTDAFADDSANLYAVRTEVVNYLLEEGEITDEEAAEDLNLYCQHRGDCTFGTGACDGTGAGRCVALGLSAEQIAEYVTQRQAQLDACVEAGTLTQEDSDAMLANYQTMLDNRANVIRGNQQRGEGICENEGTCSGLGEGNKYGRGNGRGRGC